MNNNRDKDVIKYWLRLYNRLTGSKFEIHDWPDKDPSKQNIDALCRNEGGYTLGIEHTLIEPFEGEKGDAARFLRTLATLENHPSLLQPGYVFIISQPIGSIPAGINWEDVPKEFLKQLPGILPTLPENDSEVVIKGSTNWEIKLHIKKLQMQPNDHGKVLTSRLFPGDPGPELFVNALKRKAPKLASSSAEKKILLLEKDAVAGTIECQFEQLPEEKEIKALLASIDEIWVVNTAGLTRENVIFTNRLGCRNFCSLNVVTDEFWRVLPP